MNLNDCADINYTDKFVEIKQLYRVWVKRILTPLGRIAVLKSLILSKIVYLWTLLPNPPDEFLQALRVLCLKFVWNNKQDRISRKVARRGISQGGNGFPDVNCFMQALKLGWMRNLRTTTHKWKSIITLSHPNLENLEKLGPNCLLSQGEQNLFWKDMFQAYKMFCNKIKPSNATEPSMEPLSFSQIQTIDIQPDTDH